MVFSTQESSAPSDDPGRKSPDFQERRIVFLLMILAALHVFLFSAAFPFFNNVDEQAHFDLVVKYSHGELPRRLELVSAESAQYIVTCSTLEYLGDFHGQPVPPPPWMEPSEKTMRALLADEGVWRKVKNWESAQPPLYYTLAGAWWRLGRWLGFEGGSQLYWLRWLNILFVTALVWLAYLAARMIFPDRKFLCLAMPALLAFMPQTAFYSVQNDVLSPLCFAAAFIGLLKFSRAETPSLWLGAATGLALAATFLVKISNLPLLAVSALVVAGEICRRARAGKLRPAAPAFIMLTAGAVLPLAAWAARCKIVFGDFTGSEQKIQILNWKLKPLAEWFHHPIFTASGIWYFLKGNLATFWQGEFLWLRQPQAIHAVDLFYALLSLGLLTAAFLPLLRPPSFAAPQRAALWFCCVCLASELAFFALLSVRYDFQDCFYPSREHPFFVSGRLMLGMLVPFLVLFACGLDRLMKNFQNSMKFLVLCALLAFMLASEIAIDWKIFPDEYNWFHL